jgi:glycosyltransferase involved in cell wall biosynthesis
MKPKYSLVIPALNGLASLRVTLPYMLSIPRSDFEIVISDNCSDDGSLDYLNSISDSRLIVVSPSSRLPHSANLNFAYKHASGEWVNHMGDDDLVFPDRFERLDEITLQAEQNSCDIIIGKSIRYIWPENIYESPNSVNSEGLFEYANGMEIVDGRETYRELINTLSIPGGGESLIRRELVQKVVDQFGYICPPDPYVEFFALRVCCYLARNVMKIDSPLYINGRMSKSVGNTLLANKNKFNWRLENPRGSWKYCPLDTYSYCTISLDAALAVEDLLGTNYLNKIFWGSICTKYAVGAARGTSIDNERTPKARLLYQCLTNYPIGFVLGVTQKVSEKVGGYIIAKIRTTVLKLFFRRSANLMLLNERVIPARVLGVSNIVELADWYPKTISSTE